MGSIAEIREIMVNPPANARPIAAISRIRRTCESFTHFYLSEIGLSIKEINVKVKQLIEILLRHDQEKEIHVEDSVYMVWPPKVMIDGTPGNILILPDMSSVWRKWDDK